MTKFCTPIFTETFLSSSTDWEPESQVPTKLKEIQFDLEDVPAVVVEHTSYSKGPICVCELTA